MSKFNTANLKKTMYYLKRNGLRDTYLAALERLHQKDTEDYFYQVPDAGMLSKQKEQSKEDDILFSILVPAYRTKESYLRAMVDSVLQQSYEKFELVIADASEDDSVEKVLAEYADGRMKYLRLAENKGISENTNAALLKASGDYIGLLDHDDLLTPDALFEMAAAIKEARKKNITLKLLYSDEDKCDESGTIYYDPHRKIKFNLDLILSNNYICHFMVMQGEFMKALTFHSSCDGAQDFDIALRAVSSMFREGRQEGAMGELPVEAERAVCHIPRVLYHWRCHRNSTAENPQSKQYAYEAGGRAIDGFLQENGLKGQAISTKHLGFYQVRYEPDLLTARLDVGAVGGVLLNKKNKITGGIYNAEGKCPYAGLYKDFSGYMHRASLIQDAVTVDIRLMKVKSGLWQTIADTLEEKDSTVKRLHCLPDGRVDCSSFTLTEEEYRSLSDRVCREIRRLGYRIVWLPEWKEKIK